MAIKGNIIIKIEGRHIGIPKELVNYFEPPSSGAGLFHINRNTDMDKIYALLKEKEGKKVYFEQLIDHEWKDFGDNMFYIVNIEQNDNEIIVKINRKPEPV